MINFNIDYLFDHKDHSELKINSETKEHAGHICESWLKKYGYYFPEESNFMINCFKQINWPDPFPKETMPSVPCICVIPEKPDDLIYKTE